MFTRKSAVAHLKLHQVTLADFEARFGSPESVVDVASKQPAAVSPNSGAGDATTSEVFIIFLKWS